MVVVSKRTAIRAVYSKMGMGGRKIAGVALLFATIWYGFHTDIDEVQSNHKHKRRRQRSHKVVESQLEPDRECFTEDGSGYTGTKQLTVSGHRCQPWASQEPHKHSYDPVKLGSDVDLTSNYCRNPDVAESEPWCYIAESDAPRFESCAIPRCPPPTTDYRSIRGLVKVGSDVRLQRFDRLTIAQAKELCTETIWCTAFTIWIATQRLTYVSGWLIGDNIRLNTHSAYSNWRVYITQAARVYPSASIFDDNAELGEDIWVTQSKYHPPMADIEVLANSFSAIPYPTDEKQYFEYVTTFNTIAEIMGENIDQLSSYSQQRNLKELHRCTQISFLQSLVSPEHLVNGLPELPPVSTEGPTELLLLPWTTPGILGDESANRHGAFGYTTVAENCSAGALAAVLTAQKESFEWALGRRPGGSDARGRGWAGGGGAGGAQRRGVDGMVGIDERDESEESEWSDQSLSSVGGWTGCLPLSCSRAARCEGKHAKQAKKLFAESAVADHKTATTTTTTATTNPKTTTPESESESESESEVCCVDVLVDLMRAVTSLLEHYGMPHMLFYGSLLGQVRAEDVIAWTSDLDWLMPAATMDQLESPLLQDMLARIGVRFWREPGTEQLGRFCVADTTGNAGSTGNASKGGKAGGGNRKEGLAKGLKRVREYEPLKLADAVEEWVRPRYHRYFPYLDGYVAETTEYDRYRTFQVLPGDKSSSCVWGNRPTRSCYTSVAVESVFPLQPCTVRGETFACPRDKAAVLEVLYGKDWRIPHKGIGTDNEKIPTESEVAAQNEEISRAEGLDSYE